MTHGKHIQHFQSKSTLGVEGNKERFRYILDWYRYGSILLPRSIGMSEMKRDCAFFQLPDDIKIQQEYVALWESMEMTERSTTEIELACRDGSAEGLRMLVRGQAMRIAMWVVQEIMTNPTALLRLGASPHTLRKDFRLKCKFGKLIINTKNRI